MNETSIADLLLEKGIRPTQQRITVLTYLKDHPVHPTADAIYRALSAQYPAFSKATVYNCLHCLADAGLIQTVMIDGQERRFDDNPLHHGHFQCDRCREIYDFSLGTDIQTVCPPGFHPSTFSVYLTGLCPHCFGKPGPGGP